MHMADALLSPTTAIGMAAAAGTVAVYSAYKLKDEKQTDIVPVMAVSSALVFAGQMINFTIPGTGSSGHICGAFLLSALIGPWAAFLSMAAILAVQCLFFADGGLLALGANIWNMGFYGCVIGYYLFWKPMLNAKWGNAPARIALSSILGCTLCLQLGAFSVVLQTLASGISELPFTAFLLLMQPIHLAIGAVEGILTAAVLIFVYQSRPELLQISEKSKSGKSLRYVVTSLAALTLVTGGLFSLYASSYPDGLEWSLFGNAEAGYAENMGLDEESYGISSSLADSAAGIQESTAFLPDYAFPDSESALGTSVSGIAGSVIIAALTALICYLAKAAGRKAGNQKPADSVRVSG